MERRDSNGCCLARGPGSRSRPLPVIGTEKGKCTAGASDLKRPIGAAPSSAAFAEMALDFLSF